MFKSHGNYNFTLLFFSVVAFYCNQFTAISAELRPSDISILWPLKSGTHEFPSQDTVFMKKGDGMCNSPLLSDWKLIPQNTFSMFEKEVLNKTNGACERDRVLEDKYFFEDDRDLLIGTIPLARLKGYHPFACQTKNWRVTAMRFDPCANSADFIKEGKACQSELRVVAQLVEKSETGVNNLRDFAIHLIYKFKLDDSKNVINELKEVANVSKISEQSHPWEPQFDKEKILRPHHGLRNEMDICDGPVRKAIINFMDKRAKPEFLTQMAWMTSSIGVKEWTFGAFNVLESGTKLSQIKVNSQVYDNFSDNQMMKGEPSLNKEFKDGAFGSVYNEIALASLGKLPDAEKDRDSFTKHVDRISRILNPTLTSQLDPVPCTSCHLAPQILTRLEEMYESNQKSKAFYDVKVWPGFLSEKRKFIHFRNFGYGPSFSLSINLRAITETDFGYRYLAKLFP